MAFVDLLTLFKKNTKVIAFVIVLALAILLILGQMRPILESLKLKAQGLG